MLKHIFSIGPVRLFCVAACLLLAGSAHAASWRWMSADQLMGLLREGSGMWLIDVRGPLSYERERIESSVNIPANMLQHKKFPPAKRLVLIDDSLGLRLAREAAEALAGRGHENVFILEGGLASWALSGKTMVVHDEAVLGVSVRDLRWALENSVPMLIVDMRSAGDRAAGTIEQSEPMPGATLDERMEALKARMQQEQRSGMADALSPRRTVLVVFSASEDAARLIQAIPRQVRGDMRYLIGGYEAYAPKRGTRVVGDCPTCPAAK